MPALYSAGARLLEIGEDLRVITEERVFPTLVETILYSMCICIGNRGSLELDNPSTILALYSVLIFIHCIKHWYALPPWFC